MKKFHRAHQYDAIANHFSAIHNIGQNSNNENRNVFYSKIDFIQSGSRVLDLGCGDGLDMVYYQELGAKVYGLDRSKKMIALARKRLPKADIRVGFFEQMSYPDNHFDAVLSKYALMTESIMEPAFKETWRILKPGGVLLYLVVHPFRQYFERKNVRSNYFDRSVVNSNILNGAITVCEPTHTMNEYLSPFLFQRYDVLEYDERWDPAAEMVDGRMYPGYLIIKARKR